MGEATLCFICITIGGILAVIFGSSIRKTQAGTGGSSTGLTVTGLVFSIIGCNIYINIFYIHTNSFYVHISFTLVNECTAKF